MQIYTFLFLNFEIFVCFLFEILSYKLSKSNPNFTSPFGQVGATQMESFSHLAFLNYKTMVSWLDTNRTKFQRKTYLSRFPNLHLIFFGFE